MRNLPDTQMISNMRMNAKGRMNLAVMALIFQKSSRKCQR